MQSENELLDRSLSTEEREDNEQKNETPASVTFATQDYPIDGLVKRMNSKAMVVPQFRGNDDRIYTAGFQRGFVWTKNQMDKFVESLLLGYPIPGIFLVKQPQDNRLLILDGQQRLETLRQFYSGVYGDKVFSLSNVGKEFEGLTYDTLDESLRIKLDDSYMQATIVSADGSGETSEAIYQIFERLNSGGTQLTPHEIRVALFAGNIMSSIERLNQNSDWRSLYGRPSKRIRDHELIMRILAMFEDGDSYKKPLKTFLNTYAENSKNRDVDNETVGQLFKDAVRIVSSQIGSSAFRRRDGLQVNAAQAEAVIVAVMKALKKGPHPSDLREKFEKLQHDELFIKSTNYATADTDSVYQRLSQAIKILVNDE